MDYKREVEGHADVQLDPRRAKNLPKFLRTVEELLRKQHAVCPQDRPYVDAVLDFLDRGVGDPVELPSDWFCGEAARPWRLLLGRVCEVLGIRPPEISSLADFRIHASEMEGDTQFERCGGLDQIFGCWRADVSQRDGRRYYLP